jgi:hypothetical protein
MLAHAFGFWQMFFTEDTKTLLYSVYVWKSAITHDRRLPQLHFVFHCVNKTNLANTYIVISGL